jgi:hypothetical protein
MVHVIHAVLYEDGAESLGICYLKRFEIISLEMLAFFWTAVSLSQIHLTVSKSCYRLNTPLMNIRPGKNQSPRRHSQRLITRKSIRRSWRICRIGNR